MDDYSQNGEQKIILDYFKGQTGYFLDIGANDGVTLSNSRALVLLGWHGVLVDPAEIAFKKLNDLYHGGNPEWKSVQKCVNAAIVEKDGPVDFWDCGTHMKKGDTSLLATTRPEAMDRWKKSGEQFTKTTVPGMTFASLLKKVEWSAFDFISIDCEGADWDVLQQIDLTKVGCQMLCVEVNGKDASKFTNYAAKHGLKLHWKCYENRIYVK